MTTYLFITDPDASKPESVDEISDSTWSCAKSTSPGDSAFVYLTGGRGIAYEWLVLSPATPDPAWTWVCRVKLVRKIEPSIAVAELRATISRELWGAPYTNFRGMRSIRIPDDAVQVIRQLRPTT